MRKHGRTDANQTEIVAHLRMISRSVRLTVFVSSAMGNGFPDLVIGYLGRNFLIELKDPKKPPSERKLTEAESLFHGKWDGQIATCGTVDEILKVIGLTFRA